MDLSRNRSPGVEGPRPGQEGYRRSTQPGALVQGLDDLITMRNGPKPQAPAPKTPEHLDRGSLVSVAMAKSEPRVVLSIGRAMERGLPREHAKILIQAAAVCPSLAKRLSTDSLAVTFQRPLTPDALGVYKTLAMAGPAFAGDRRNLDALAAMVKPQTSAWGSWIGLLRAPKVAPAAAMLGRPEMVAALQRSPQAVGIVAAAMNAGKLDLSSALRMCKTISTSATYARMIRANPRPATVASMASLGFRRLVKHTAPEQRAALSRNPKALGDLTKAAARLDGVVDLANPEVAQAVVRNPRAFSVIVDVSDRAMHDIGADREGVQANARALVKAAIANPEMADRLSRDRAQPRLAAVVRMPDFSVSRYLAATVEQARPDFGRGDVAHRLEREATVNRAAFGMKLLEHGKLAERFEKFPQAWGILDRLRSVAPHAEAELVRSNPEAVIGAARAVASVGITEGQAARLLERAADDPRLARQVASGRPADIKRLAHEVSRNNRI